MKEVTEGTLAEKVGEERVDVDTKNPQEAEVDIDFSSAEGTIAEKVEEEGA